LETALRDLGFGTNLVALEESSAKLLHDYSNSPEVCGRIYMALLGNWAYRNGGASNVITVSQKALQCPLEDLDQCQAYEYLGVSLDMQSKGASLRQETVLRKEALAVYLNGLKFVLSKAKTLERQPVPKVLKESILTSVTPDTNWINSPEHKAIEDKRAALIKARDEGNAANRLIDKYEEFKGGVVELYRGVPYVGEITEVGEKIMPGAPVLKELVEEVKKAKAPPPATNSITNPGR